MHQATDSSCRLPCANGSDQHFTQDSYHSEIAAPSGQALSLRPAIALLPGLEVLRLYTAPLHVRPWMIRLLHVPAAALLQLQPALPTCMLSDAYQASYTQSLLGTLELTHACRRSISFGSQFISLPTAAATSCVAGCNCGTNFAMHPWRLGQHGKRATTGPVVQATSIKTTAREHCTMQRFTS